MKKSGELWSTSKKGLVANIEPPKCIFGGDYILAPRGICGLKFIHALEIAQALIALTRSGTGVPRKKFNRENLKFALKFSVLATITSGVVRVSQACRGYGYPWINPWIYPWIYPCVDMRLGPSCGYIHGYYAGTPTN